jgi:hypothetical protein
MTARCGWVLPLAAAALWAAGCTDAGGAPPVATVRDSAGIRLVENRGQMWTEETAWTVGSPRLEVGGLDVDPEYQIYQVQGATVLSDGRVVVADNGSKELRYYDASGRFLEAVGRRGGGPGEFGNLWSLQRIAGDSLLIWDPGNLRFAVHDADGVFARTFKLEMGPSGLARFPGPQRSTAFRDGSFLGVEWMGGRFAAPTGVYRDTIRYFLFDPTGRDMGPVAAFPFMEWFISGEQTRMMNGQMMRVSLPVLFGAEFNLASDNSTFWMGDGGPTLSRFDRDGRLLQRIRRTDLERTPVTGALRARAIESRVAEAEARGDDETALNQYRRRLQDVPARDTVPAYQEILVDGLSNLWVKHHAGLQEPAAPSAWDVFEADGRFLGAVELPPHFEPFEIGEDYILGIRLDELDIEYLVLLPLIKPGGRPGTRRLNG